MARFEVVGRTSDRELIRKLARVLAENANTAEARKLRAAISQAIHPEKGGIYAALRRSPLVGADLDLAREHVEPRNVDLG